MSRRLSMMLVVGLAMLVTPRLVHAQEFRDAFTGAPRKPSLSRVWSGLDFGARRIGPLPTPGPWGHSRRLFDSPSQESGWRHVPARKGHRGDLVRAPMFEVSQFAGPIDCAMAKPGDPTLDPKLIRPAPVRPVHSGVIIPVAPCRWK